MQKAKLFGIAMAGVVGLTAIPAFANGLLEDRPWQFQNPDDRAVDIMRENLRERKAGGYYEQWQVDQDFICEDGATCTNVGAGGTGTQNTAIGNYKEVNGDGNVFNDKQTNNDSKVGANSNEIGRDLVDGGNGVNQPIPGSD